MKGTNFQKPLELNLLIDGESWRQGDSISGTLNVRNHGSEPVSMEGIAVRLAVGQNKKVREKSPEAFEVLASCPADSVEPLAPGLQRQYPWKFELDRNAPISDGRASLFVVYGKGEALEQQGNLQLPVHPDSRIEDFLNTLKTQFRFVEKSRRAAAKERVEIKLAPPSSKELSRVEGLTLLIHFDGDAFEVEYSFQIKKLESGPVAMDVKKSKKEFEQRFEPSDYRIASGRWNHERMEAAIREVITPVTASALF